MTESPCELTIDSADAMEALGATLAHACNTGCVIYLHGELGTGKTTLTRGFLRGLGHTGNVKSPTYTLLEPYQLDNWRVCHFDVYRLADPEELEYLGVRDYLDDKTIWLVEWPERGAGILPPADLEVFLTYAGVARSVRIAANTANGGVLIDGFQQKLH